MHLENLLLECADALAVRSHDGGNRQGHLHQIEALLKDASVDRTAMRLLSDAAMVFRDDLGKEPIQLAALDGEDNRVRQVRNGIEAYLGCDQRPLYLFHGTITVHLPSILRDGLVPRRHPVWGPDLLSRELCNSASFFCSTWRSALSWAEAASAMSKDHQQVERREPAVIRLSSESLELKPDPMAQAPGCYMIKGPISAANAEVIVGRVQGFPKWRPIKQVMDGI